MVRQLFLQLDFFLLEFLGADPLVGVIAFERDDLSAVGGDFSPDLLLLLSQEKRVLGDLLEVEGERVALKGRVLRVVSAVK